MAANTVSLENAIYSASNVFGVRHWLQMVGVNARRVATQMIQHEMVGKWSVYHFVNNAMRVSFALPSMFVKNCGAVAVGFNVAGPIPTRGRVGNTSGEVTDNRSTGDTMGSHSTNVWWNGMRGKD